MGAPKILVISLGSIGMRHLKNARALLPAAEIAVYRQHTPPMGKNEVPEGANAVFHSFEDAVLFGPDAVIVASPASEHLRLAQPFLDRGVHIFLEKPLAADAAGVDEFVQCARASRGFTMVGYVLRFLPALRFVRQCIEESRIGNVSTVHIQVGQYLPDWRPGSDYRLGVSAQRKLGGGVLLELSHEIDYSLWLFGQPDTFLCSTGRLSQLQIDVEDSAQIIMEYTAKKMRVLVELDFLQRTPSMSLRAVGSEGTLVADFIKETVAIAAPKEDPVVVFEPAPQSNANEIYLRQFDFFFAKCFRDYAPIFCDTAKFEGHADVGGAATIIKFIDAARRSSDEGRRIIFNGHTK